MIINSNIVNLLHPNIHHTHYTFAAKRKKDMIFLYTIIVIKQVKVDKLWLFSTIALFGSKRVYILPNMKVITSKTLRPEVCRQFVHSVFQMLLLKVSIEK